jgi:hypothetical protein
LFGVSLRERPPVRAAHLFSAFRGLHLWNTVKVSLMVTGAQGGGYALGIWMPTHLRTVRHLSATSTGGFLPVQIFGTLLGFLLGAYLSDIIGRKFTFLWSAIGSFIGILLYMFLPMNNTALLFFGIPLLVVFLMKFPPMGPFMTELFPTSVRGTAHGFCYNAGRARIILPDHGRISEPGHVAGRGDRCFQCNRLRADDSNALNLPETRGRSLASLEAEPARLPGAAQ